MYDVYFQVRNDSEGILHDGCRICKTSDTRGWHKYSIFRVFSYNFEDFREKSCKFPAGTLKDMSWDIANESFMATWLDWLTRHRMMFFQDHPLVLHDSELDCITVDRQTVWHVSGSCPKIVVLSWNMEHPLKLFNPHIKNLRYQGALPKHFLNYSRLETTLPYSRQTLP